MRLSARGKTVAREIAERITVDPDVMVGKPVVKGTRIPVELVLEQLAYNPDLGELFAAYPHLTVEDVKACLAFARTAVANTRRLRNHRSRAVEHAAHA
jgi:uncharacterized protein (DUF433 family)